MSKLNTKVIIIDDDKSITEGGLYIELGQEFEEIQFFEDPGKGIAYIQEHLSEKMLVLLDLSFPQNFPDGDSILESIRKLTHLLPVIIWSGVNEDKSVYTSLINNRAFAFIPKNASSEEIVTKLKEAHEVGNEDISRALEEWIDLHPEEELNKPYIITIDNKQFTLNDVLKEIRLQTPTGRKFTKNLNKLTIDLITRNIENLND